MTSPPSSGTPRPDDLLERFVHGFSWSLAAAVAGRTLGLASSLLLPRILGPEGQGTLGVLTSFLGLVTIVGVFGTNTALLKLVPEMGVRHPERVPGLVSTTFIAALVMAGLVSTCLVLASPVLASGVYARPDIQGYLGLMGLAVVPNVLAILASGAMQGYQAFRSLALASTAVSLIGVPIQLGMAWAFGLSGAVAAVGAMSVVGGLVLFGAVLREARRTGRPLRARFERQGFVQAVRFAFPIFLSAVPVVAAPWIVNTALVRASCGPTGAGWFSVAWSFWDLVLFLPTQATAPSVTVYSELVARGDHRVLEATCKKNVKVLWLVTLMVALPLATSAPLVMGGVFGEPYAEGWPAMFFLCAGTLGVAANIVYGFLLLSYGKVWHAVLLNGSWFLLLVLGLLVLVPSYGATGAAIAYAIAYGGFTVLLAVYSRRALDIRIRGLAGGTAFTAAAFGIGWALASSLGMLSALAALPLTGLVFAIVWKRGLEDEERTFVRTRFATLVRRRRDAGPEGS